MTTNRILNDFSAILMLLSIILSGSVFAQQNDSTPKMENQFWKNVQFGGRIGLGFGSGFTDISVAPSAIYNFNEYVAFGAGLQYKYLKQRDFCVSFVWRKRNCTLNP
jgi:hypothetical protein